jgi:TP901 family phage tail tape measure protein
VQGISLTTLLIHVKTDVNKAIGDLARLDAKVKGSSIVGGAAAKATGYAVVAALGYSAKAFIDFDAEMTESIAIMGNVSDAMRDKLEKGARDVAATTTFSAKKAAEAYFFLASSGLNATEALAAMPAVAKFAQAGMFDLATATEYLVDAQAALGLSVKNDAIKNMENMVRVSDVLVKANILSNATVEQLADSLTNKAGGALRIVGKDIEEGTAVLAAFAKTGLKGQAAGTALYIILRDLQTAAIKNGDEFKKFGISVYDSTGNMRNMADIIGDLEGAFEGMSDKEKRATLRMLGFQDRSIASLQTLIGLSGEIRNYEKELRNAGGTTETIAKKQLESFKNQLILIWHRTQNLAILLGSWLVPKLFEAGAAVHDLADKVVALLRGPFGTMGDIIHKIRDAFGSLAGPYGVAGFAVILDDLVGGEGRYIGFFTNVGDVIMDVFNFIKRNWEPIKVVFLGLFGGAAVSILIAWAAALAGPVVGAVVLLGSILASPIALLGALAAGLYYAYTEVEGFRKAVDGAARWVRDTLIPALSDFTDWVIKTGTPTVRAFAEFIIGAWRSVATWAVENWGLIKETFQKGVNTVIILGKFMVKVLQATWKAFGDNIVRHIQIVWRLVTGIFDAALDVILGLYTVFMGVFTGNWSKAWDGVRQVFRGVWGGITNIFRAAWDTLLNILDVGLSGLRLIWDVAWEGLKDVVPGSLRAVRDLLWRFFEELPGKLGRQFINVRNWLYDFGFNLIKGFLRGAKAAFVNVLTWFGGLSAKIAMKLQDATAWIFDEGDDTMKGFLAGVEEGAEDVTTWFTELPAKVVGWTGDAGEWLVTAGSDAMIGFFKGVSNYFQDTVVPWFIDLPNKAGRWLTNTAEWFREDGLEAAKGFLLGVWEFIDNEVVPWFMDLPHKLQEWIPNAIAWLQDDGLKVMKGLLIGLGIGALLVGAFFLALPGIVLLGLAAVFIAAMIGVAQALFNGFVRGLAAALPIAIRWFKKVPRAILDGLGEYWNWLVHAGKMVVQGFIDGMKSMGRKLWETATGMAKTVIDAVTNPLSILSPSKLFHQFGVYTAQGFIDGINSMSSKVDRAVDAMLTIPKRNRFVFPVRDVSIPRSSASNLEPLRRAVAHQSIYQYGGGVGGSPLAGAAPGGDLVSQRALEEIVARLMQHAKPNVDMKVDMKETKDPMLVGAELAWNLK